MTDDTLFELGADINLSGTEVWSGANGYILNAVRGTFDGKGYRLYGIENADGDTEPRMGVIASFEAGSVFKNTIFQSGGSGVVLSTAANNGNQWTDGVFGTIKSGAVVENCVFDFVTTGGGWTSSFFRAIEEGGTLQDCILKPGDGAFSAISYFTNGMVENVAVIRSSYPSTGDTVAALVGTAGPNNGTHVSTAAKDIYFYLNVENMISGTGIWLPGYTIADFDNGAAALDHYYDQANSKPAPVFENQFAGTSFTVNEGSLLLCGRPFTLNV